MAPLLKSLLGHGSKDREHTEEMKALLQEMQQERIRYEALLASVRSSSEHLQTLGEPIAKAGSDVESVTSRIGDLESRFAAMVQLVPKFESMHERVEGLVEGQHRAESQVVQALEDASRIRASFADIGARIEQALSLKERLENFLEVEKPFQQVRDDVGTLRGQVEGTGDHLTKLREQHDRLLDAHKLATTKMEALDRRREELSRDLQDKERRVASVAQAVRGLDGVQHTVDDLKRQMGTLKALGDFVAQKGAALEAQREAVENALARADNLDRSMRQVDAGMRQQQENEASLAALQDRVAALQSLHETVLDRSREITQLQRDTDEQAREMRIDLAAAQEELKKSVERFEFESRGLESVSQRVTDVRGSLSDFENRFKGLSESSQTVAALLSQAQGLSGQLQNLSAEVERIDEESGKLQSIRRDLDELTRVARDTGAKVVRIEEARPAVDAALRDFEQLRGSHALVKDALEQAQIANGEMTRVREAQAGTREWLTGVEQGVTGLKAQVERIEGLRPVVDLADQQTRRIGEAMDLIQSRQEFVEELQGRLTQLGTLGGNLDERGRQLMERMQAAEQRFAGLSAQAEEAGRTARVVAETSSGLGLAARGTEEVGRKVAALEARCESVETLAERTQALKKELDQRQNALESAKKDLQKASGLRQDAATSAQKLDELASRLTAALGVAEGRVTQLEVLATKLEHRATDLQPAEHRLDRFEERMAKWNLVEQDVARSLEQLSARQGTVDALSADLDRMFGMAEKTAIEVREITSAQRGIEDSRNLLDSVMARLQDVRDMASALDERKRQTAKAEERLARAEALLVDVHSSLEALQGQKVIVDQAVEKTGSLRVLVKQAEGMVESLREERELVGRVRAAVGIVRQDADDDFADDETDGPAAKAA
jgi:DNA repair exonuclease SbcCD ATPase subunit